MIDKELFKIIQEVKPHRKLLTLVGVSGVLFAASNSRVVFLLKELMDKLTVGNVQGMQQIVFICMGLAFISAVTRYLHISRMNYIAELVVMSLRLKLQSKFMHLSLSFHNNYTTGSGGMLSRILNDIKVIQDCLRLVADFFLYPLLFVFLLINLLMLDWKLTISLFIVAPVLGVFLKNVTKSLRKYAPLGQIQLEKMTSTIKESLDGVRIIQSFSLEKVMSEKLKLQGDEYLEIRRKFHNRAEAQSPVTEFIATCLILSVCLYIAYQVSHGQATAGTFIGFVGSLIALNLPIKKIQESYVRLQEMISSAQRVYEILESNQEVSQIQNTIPFPKEWKKIEYRNVEFSYGNEKILKGVTFTIHRGDAVAFVGESGSGKSTIVNLLMRFFDPQSGHIMIDGIDIQKFNLHELRQNIALVSQDVFLFSDTIEKNIQAGNLDQQAQDVQSVAKAASAHDFIMKMPEGYQSRVGDRGNLLSGGEKQRISIARALYKNAPLLILDEATSALDTASEVEVQKGLDLLMQGRTSFVVAHRLSTVAKSSRIYVMKAGQIIEFGTHQELLAAGGEYKKFHLLQT